MMWLRYESRKFGEIRAEGCHAKRRDFVDVVLLYQRVVNYQVGSYGKRVVMLRNGGEKNWLRYMFSNGHDSTTVEILTSASAQVS